MRFSNCASSQPPFNIYTFIPISAALGQISRSLHCRNDEYDNRLLWTRYIKIFLFRYPFHPRVTAVACKRPQPCCQKCRWQITANYACAYVALHEVTWLYGVHRTRRDGSSFMWHQPCQRCKYTTSVDIQKRAIIKGIHSCRITRERSECSRAEKSAI